MPSLYNGQPSWLDFVASRDSLPRNSWFYLDNGLEVYLRKGPRYVQGVLIPYTVCIANVVSRNPGRGIFTGFLNELLGLGVIVYVESVVNPRLARYLASNGFTQVDAAYGGRNFIKPKTP